jgi:hypothetical protein
MERTENIPGLSLEVESLVAHLQILGYWPVRYYFPWNRSGRNAGKIWYRYGVRNSTQVIIVRYDRVEIDPAVSHMTFEDIEWWQLTDKAIRLIAYSLDNTLAGW